MPEEEKGPSQIAQFLDSGRHLLSEASETFGRALLPEEYWLFGVGLAALTLGSLNGQTHAVDRFDSLLEELGYQGVKGDWWGRFVSEVAGIGSVGMLWPVFERKESGQIEPTGCRVRSDFDGTDAYWVSLAHVAGALAQSRADTDALQELADMLLELIEGSRTRELEEAILDIFHSFQGADHRQS